ncbi:T9SS type A sorting domain-containing protein [Mangrovimonas sp. AS39]|uniref:T9SS type A sorting domain-containing protein n=1 Tax=Mangrovimonas futianensis TaxID=2895523 RepID=UPI001E2B232C|nr:T9SS type A sorting domain-containing protein [Mangrovimonas futianensis]MCF1191637.1 T9SS type A sorting domain-containing protein [Mangrovimonas futianensis]MCF1195475.1 T9SS type A sorting domain-containing protein [Mangrovimonas futianensis]
MKALITIWLIGSLSSIFGQRNSSSMSGNLRTLNTFYMETMDICSYAQSTDNFESFLYTSPIIADDFWVEPETEFLVDHLSIVGSFSSENTFVLVQFFENNESGGPGIPLSEMIIYSNSYPDLPNYEYTNLYPISVNPGFTTYATQYDFDFEEPITFNGATEGKRYWIAISMGDGFDYVEYWEVVYDDTEEVPMYEMNFDGTSWGSIGYYNAVFNLFGTCDQLSVDDFQLSQLKIYPNPAKDFITIEDSNQVNLTSTFYNMLGNPLMESKNKFIDVSNLSSGIYLLKIENEQNQSKLFRLVKE